MADLLTRAAARQKVRKSDLLRNMIERIAMDQARFEVRKSAWRRQRIVRRCIICTAFVRSGYTCRTCRTMKWDSIVVEGNVVPVPSMPRMPLTTRPDLRDNRWQTAEQVVLDAFCPLTGIIYELLTQEDCLEPTNLDEIRDLLVLAASINK